MRIHIIPIDTTVPDRNKFLNFYKEKLFSLSCIEKIRKHSPAMRNVIYEMIKNIYDHSGETGVIIIYEKKASVSFEIFDYGMGNFDFNTLHDSNSTQKSCSQNAGMGLKMINQALMIEPYNRCVRNPVILTHQGFYYSWEFHFYKE
jgi:K+-sensing histidine kinase KdpD